MQNTPSTTALFFAVIMVGYPIFSMSQEDRVQEKIENITPVSDAIPLAIMTTQYDDAGTAQANTRGMRRKYQVDYERNPQSMLANRSYEEWFLSIGLNDSDPNDERYGIWYDVSNVDRCTLHIFSPQEQYLLVTGRESVWIGNIFNPIDKVQENEKQLNGDSWSRPYSVVNFRVDRTGILIGETTAESSDARLVSFTKTPDGDFCLTVESPKSKSLFVFVPDKEETNTILEFYNQEKNAQLEEPLPGMIRWKVKEFKTPTNIEMPKEFRRWRIKGESPLVARFVSCDGKSVVLEKEDGQQLSIALSQLEWDGASQRYIKLVLTAESGGEETETIRSLDFRPPDNDEPPFILVATPQTKKPVAQVIELQPGEVLNPDGSDVASTVVQSDAEPQAQSSSPTSPPPAAKRGSIVVPVLATLAILALLAGGLWLVIKWKHPF